MISVITGDIVNSRSHNPSEWLPKLKIILNEHGHHPLEWEIYRGDNFQLKVGANIAFTVVLKLKAAMRGIKGMDVRLGVGIGLQDFAGVSISESNGSAYAYSGCAYDSLGKKTLVISSEWPALDRALNLYFDLAVLIIDRWTPVSSEMMSLALRHPTATQAELARMVGKSQPTVSETLKRAGYDELLDLDHYYRTLVNRMNPTS